MDFSGNSLILPIDTQVVVRTVLPATTLRDSSRAGAVGVIVGAPKDNIHSYRIRLVDGVEVSLKRSEFSIRKHYQRTDIAENTEINEESLYRGIILKVVVGSRTYGLERDESDTDIRGVFVPPANLHWSLFGVPEQLEREATQECYWELRLELEKAGQASNLPETASVRAALNDLLVRVRTTFSS
jgi:hypothetical protein